MLVIVLGAVIGAVGLVIVVRCATPGARFWRHSAI